jgi:acetylornithine deacetylase/succinyl-diaminopimelate desuccinylase-like protein
MDLSRLLARAAAIQAIPAPTFGETERAAAMAAYFHEAGLDGVELDSIGNVLGRRGHGAAPVVLAAHLDTVFPHGTDLRLIRSSQRWAGPGIGDNALGLAALVELAIDLAEPEPDRAVWFVCTVGEEGLGNLRGMARVVERFGASVSAYIALEGMSLGFVFTRAFPVRRYRIQVEAPGGHSWIHAGRPSAIHQVLRLGSQILAIPLPTTPKCTINIGRLQGGTGVNAIARQASMELELRAEEGDALDGLAAHVERLLDVPWPERVEVAAELIGIRPHGAIPDEHPLVRAACRAHLQACGCWPQLTGGSTDASLPQSLGYPAICVGLTTGSNAHTPMESIELGPLACGYAALLGLVRELTTTRI